MKPFVHGMHFLRPDHIAGTCVSCGADATPRYEQGWPDAVSMCDRCEDAIRFQALAAKARAQGAYAPLMRVPPARAAVVVLIRCQGCFELRANRGAVFCARCLRGQAEGWPDDVSVESSATR